MKSGRKKENIGPRLFFYCRRFHLKAIIIFRAPNKISMRWSKGWRVIKFSPDNIFEELRIWKRLHKSVTIEYHWFIIHYGIIIQVYVFLFELSVKFFWFSYIRQIFEFQIHFNNLHHWWALFKTKCTLRYNIPCKRISTFVPGQSVELREAAWIWILYYNFSLSLFPFKKIK